MTAFRILYAIYFMVFRLTNHCRWPCGCKHMYRCYVKCCSWWIFKITHVVQY